MPAPYTYDPKQVALIVGGVPIGGYADGTFISAERTADTFTKVSGGDGVVSRSKTNDKSGTIAISLQKTSPSNDVLAGFALLDETSNSGIVPIVVQDFSGRTTIVSAFGWVKKLPKAEFSKEVTNTEWMLDCADLDIKHGGNAGVN